MKIFSLRSRISIILLVWVMVLIGCSSSNIEELPSERPIHQFATKEGKQHYLNLCLPCHGENGKGDGIYWASALDITPADLTKFTSSESNRIFQTIKNGAESQGKSNLCPPWKNNILDEEIDYIVSYVLTLEE